MRRKSLSLYALIACFCFALTAWVTQSRIVVYASAEQHALGSAGFKSSSRKQVVSNLPADSATPLRILSWNIQFGQGTDGLTNYDWTSAWIAQINPDFVALSEVPLRGYSAPCEQLVPKTGRTWYSHWVPKFVGCAEGNLILSKFAFQSVNSRFLSYNRSVAQVTINVGGRLVNFFATHLDDGSSAGRTTEVAELLNWASGFAEPRIFAGDFNGGPDTSEIGQMTISNFDSWNEAMNAGTAIGYADNPVSWMTRTRRGRIDYVFYSRSATSLVLRSTQIPDSRDLNNTNVVVWLGTLDDRGVRPSDHNQMVANFDVYGPGAPPTPTPDPNPNANPNPNPTPHQRLQYLYRARFQFC